MILTNRYPGDILQQQNHDIRALINIFLTSLIAIVRGVEQA